MLTTNITYLRAKTAEEFNQILELQQRNLPQNLSRTERKTEGFVTVKHSFKLLEQMNNACPHIIAKHQDKILGYALCMTRDYKLKIPILIPMFNEIESVIPDHLSYVVMGQRCIDKVARSQGIFRGLYQFMGQELKKDFNAIITEVDIKNTRSLNAHKAVGFKSLKNYTSNNRTWQIISLSI